MIRLLDTNHAIAYLNNDPRLDRYLNEPEASQDQFALTTTVLGELYYGAYRSARVAQNLAKLSEFVPRVILYDFDASAAEEFGKIRAEQQTKGKTIPTADAQIAAVARRHNLTVLTDDGHFAFVDGLTVQNWLE